LGSSSMNSVNGYSSRIPARGGSELKHGTGMFHLNRIFFILQFERTDQSLSTQIQG
jgi:hypothetical protein